MKKDVLGKIAFVTPWFGENIPGGAENALRGIATHLNDSGLNIEILTTCVKEFASDWNSNYYKPGLDQACNLPVRRFPIRKRNVKAFDEINEKLMRNMEITKEEENTFINEMINSPKLYEYIKQNKQGYDFFIYIPYMFGTTYYGIKVCPEKSIMIPCFHDESYIYLSIFKELYSKVKGMIFNAKPESELANKVYNLSKVRQIVPGLGVDTHLIGDKERFRKKYGINDPFIIYAGRKDAGKNVDNLVKYFARYRKTHNQVLKLILIGGGNIEIHDEMKLDIMDLGFVPIQDKFDAYAAAELLCQPSKNESFSYVIMESWLCKRPVLVHNQCEVTKNFVKESWGGLYFDDYLEFEGTMDYLLSNSKIANQMGENGHKYVMDHFRWDVIVKKYTDFLLKLMRELNII